MFVRCPRLYAGYTFRQWAFKQPIIAAGQRLEHLSGTSALRLVTRMKAEVSFKVNSD